MIKLLFLSDNAIRQSMQKDSLFIQNPDDQELIFQAQVKLLEAFDNKITSIVLTNKGGVEAPYKPLNNLHFEEIKLLQMSDLISGIIYSISDDEAYSISRYDEYWGNIRPRTLFYNEWRFRKPNIGMIKEGIILYQNISNSEIEPSEIIMVGDREEDKECAKNSGINFMWAKDWHCNGLLKKEI